MSKNLRQKLVEVSKSIGFIEFDGHNPVYGKKGSGKANYASAAGVIRQLNSALAEVGVLAAVTEEEVEFFPEAELAIVKCSLTYFDSESDETVTVKGSGSGKDRGDKAVMKASTAAIKYAIAHSLTLGWGAEDPEDPKHDASNEPAAKSKRRPSARSGKPSKAAIAKEIKAAATLEELNGEIKDKVLATRGTNAYDELKELFRTRRSELEGESE